MTFARPLRHLADQFRITEAAAWVFVAVSFLLIQNRLVAAGQDVVFAKRVILIFAAFTFFIHRILPKWVSLEKCMMVESFGFLFFSAALVQLTGGSVSPFWILCYFPIVISLMILRIGFCLWIFACTAVLSSVVIVRTFLGGQAEELPILILNIFCLLTLTLLSYLSTQEIVQERELKNRAISDRDQALLASEKHLQLVEEKSQQIEEYSQKLSEVNCELLGQQTHLLKLTQELEKANEDLKEVNEMKSEFVSMVSHELRTPLTAIKESVLILQEDADESLTLEQKKFLDITHSNAERLAVLIQDILDFSKLESGKLKIRKEKVGVGVTLELLQEFYDSEARKKGIHLEFEIVKSNHLYVYADGGRLRQVLDNLLSNAMKFTPAGGKISVNALRMGREEVLEAMRQWEADQYLLTVRQMEQLTSWKNFIVVSVRDTGAGITKEDIRRIFEKFFQLDIHETRPRGTGLGLAIVKQLVLLHQGGFWVESQVAQGSCFRICLPSYEEAFQCHQDLDQIVLRMKEACSNGMFIMVCFEENGKNSKVFWQERVLKLEGLEGFIHDLVRQEVYGVCRVGGHLLILLVGQDHVHPLEVVEKIRLGIQNGDWRGWEKGLRFSMQSFSGANMDMETLLRQIQEMSLEVDHEK